MTPNPAEAPLASPLARWRALSFPLALSVLLLVTGGCDRKTADADADADADAGDGDDTREAALVADEASRDGAPSKDDREARRAAKKAAGASFAEHAAAFEKLVVAGDVDAIDAMWASAKQLEGCLTKEQDMVDGKMVRVDTDETWAAQTARQREGFDNERTLLAKLEHGETFRHRSPVWANRGINEAFGGDCSIEFHGEVWFDALVKNRPDTDGVRHRAYFGQIGDQWKLLRINGPDLVDCENVGDRSHMVCKKIRGEEVEE